MNLFYICGEDSQGFICSLFVNAATPADAFEIWKNHPATGGNSKEDFESDLSTNPVDMADEDDLRIFQIPLHLKNGPLTWHEPGGVQCVAYAKEI